MDRRLGRGRRVDAGVQPDPAPPASLQHPVPRRQSYPYLALTVGEKWPRAQVLRGAKRKGVRYFGPYGHAWAIRDTLDALTRVFPVRTCSNAFFDQRARAKRPCLYYDIGRCAGPCVPMTTGVTDEGYREIVERLADFLAGNHKPVLAGLEAEMA